MLIAFVKAFRVRGALGGKNRTHKLISSSKIINNDCFFHSIECPPATDGMERFACPTPDRQGRYRCIDDHVLCDGFIDCPEGADEDRQACMFYKTVSKSRRQHFVLRCSRSVRRNDASLWSFRRTTWDCVARTINRMENAISCASASFSFYFWFRTFDVASRPISPSRPRQIDVTFCQKTSWILTWFHSSLCASRRLFGWHLTFGQKFAFMTPSAPQCGCVVLTLSGVVKDTATSSQIVNDFQLNVSCPKLQWKRSIKS